MFELYSLMKHDMVSEVRGGAILRRQNLCESNGKDEAHGLPNYLQLMIILPLAGDSGRKFGSYEIDGIYKQNDLVCVSNLLSVIREDAVKIFDKFTWRDGEKDCTITDVFAKFDKYCEPRTQVFY